MAKADDSAAESVPETQTPGQRKRASFDAAYDTQRAAKEAVANAQRAAREAATAAEEYQSSNVLADEAARTKDAALVRATEAADFSVTASKLAIQAQATAAKQNTLSAQASENAKEAQRIHGFNSSSTNPTIQTKARQEIAEAEAIERAAKDAESVGNQTMALATQKAAEAAEAAGLAAEEAAAAEAKYKRMSDIAIAAFQKKNATQEAAAKAEAASKAKTEAVASDMALGAAATMFSEAEAEAATSTTAASAKPAPAQAPTAVAPVVAAQAASASAQVSRSAVVSSSAPLDLVKVNAALKEQHKDMSAAEMHPDEAGTFPVPPGTKVYKITVPPGLTPEQIQEHINAAFAPVVVKMLKLPDPVQQAQTQTQAAPAPTQTAASRLTPAQMSGYQGLSGDMPGLRQQQQAQARTGVDGVSATAPVVPAPAPEKSASIIRGPSELKVAAAAAKTAAASPTTAAPAPVTPPTPAASSPSVAEQKAGIADSIRRFDQVVAKRLADSMTRGATVGSLTANQAPSATPKGVGQGRAAGAAMG